MDVQRPTFPTPLRGFCVKTQEQGFNTKGLQRDNEMFLSKTRGLPKIFPFGKSLRSLCNLRAPRVQNGETTFNTKKSKRTQSPQRNKHSFPSKIWGAKNILPTKSSCSLCNLCALCVENRRTESNTKFTKETQSPQRDAVSFPSRTWSPKDFLSIKSLRSLCNLYALCVQNRRMELHAKPTKRTPKPQRDLEFFGIFGVISLRNLLGSWRVPSRLFVGNAMPPEAAA